MLDAETLDAAVVATPPHLNAVAALPCLRRGVSTMLEKPPGLSTAETEELRDAAAASGALGMVAWNRRFHPMVVAAREMVESRGPIAQIVGEFHKPMTRLEKWERYTPEVMDNMLYETPIHAIDLVRALAASEVTQVHSVVQRRFSTHKDVHAALVEFENGCVVSITANYTTDARLERYEIHGRDVSAYLEGIRQDTSRWTAGASRSRTPAPAAPSSRPGTSSTPSGTAVPSARRPPTSTRRSRRWSCWPPSWPASASRRGGPGPSGQYNRRMSNSPPAQPVV